MSCDRPSPKVVAEVRAFLDRHGTAPRAVEPTRLRFLFDDDAADVTTEEIDVALNELASPGPAGFRPSYEVYLGPGDSR